MNLLTKRRYLLASLLTPLILPLLLGLAAKMTGNELLSVFAAIFLLSLALGGIPYLIFGVAILIWSRGRSIDEVRRISYWSPLLFLLGLSVLDLFYLMFSGDLHEFLGFLLLSSVYVPLFGYLYVFLVNFGFEMLFGEEPDDQ
jgi:hypothetical protein